VHLVGSNWRKRKQWTGLQTAASSADQTPGHRCCHRFRCNGEAPQLTSEHPSPRACLRWPQHSLFPPPLPGKARCLRAPFGLPRLLRIVTCASRRKTWLVATLPSCWLKP